ncbi:MAG: amidohydrolase [Pseudomonadales bacterium]
MKRTFAAFASLLTYAAASLTASAAAPADLVFLGEHIITMEAPDRRVGALAVRGDSIVWTGAREDAAAWIGEHTVTHELGQRALLPGFIDAHGHLTYQAMVLDLANVASPPVGPVEDIPALQQVLADYIATRPLDDAWIIGNGYDDSLLVEGRHPTRMDLDAVSGSRPIALVHVSGHLAVANSAALAVMGYDAETDDPDGGHIRRVPGTRVPNGVLEETAIGPLRAHLATPSGDPMDAVAAALATNAAHGITTVQDGAIGPPGLQLLSAMADAGRLTLDVVAFPLITAADQPLPEPGDTAAYRQGLKVGGIKLMLDGSPQGKTAYLSEAYHVPPAGQPADYRGYPIPEQALLNGLVARAMGSGVPIIAHANGDAAAQMLIDAVAASSAADGDHRTVMIHAQTVRHDQLERMQQLRMVPSFFAAHAFYWGDWHRDSVLGPERAARISPARTAGALGLPFTIHNDAPVVPPDVIRLLWAATNRLTRSGRVLGPDERIDTYAALEAVTVNAARQHFDEARKGTLTVGKQADLVLLSTSPLAMPATDLLDLQVTATWARGRLVHGNP